MIERIPVYANEFCDKNSPPIFKLEDMALTPAEVYIITKLNEIVDTINKMNKEDLNYGEENYEYTWKHTEGCIS